MSGWNERIIAEFREKGGKRVTHFGDRLLLLHVTGRRSGQTLIIPLAYHMDGDRYVVAASKGGSPDHPQWYRNLVAHPDVTVEVGNEKFRARAVPYPRGPERDRLYSDHAKLMPGFADYEKKTTRIIPAIVLERASEPSEPKEAA
jgi:deazaflavin-dependent oxidoreductase (nitroreductase family)